VRLVAHVIYRLDYGGLENGVVNLVNRIPSDRYRHAIVCLAGYSDAFRQRIRRDDVEVLSLDKRPGKDLGAYRRMWRVLRRLRPDVVHTRNLGTVDMQWVAAAAGVRFRVHGEHGWEAADPDGRSRRSLRIRRACRPVIGRYVAMSKDLGRWLEAVVRVPRSRIRQIYSGVDAQRFQPEGARPADIPWPSGSSPAARSTAGLCVIGTVGRLDPVKNQLLLVETLHRIVTADPSMRSKLRLAIIGDGPLNGALAAAVRERGLDDVVWRPGARSDVPELLRAMDLFVLPSMNEGVSNTILEAMATGLPVVAARVGGTPELVVDGETGRLYAPWDSAGLERSLLAYVRDPGSRLAHGAAGRRRVVSDFSLESMVKGYLDLYDESIDA
jgi:sugar transferase (PEP-CTERM/EpsH1 system associated)